MSAALPFGIFALRFTASHVVTYCLAGVAAVFLLDFEVLPQTLAFPVSHRIEDPCRFGRLFTLAL